MPEDPNNSIYRHALMAKLIQLIPSVAPINPPKEDKLVDRVTRQNPKTYGRSSDPTELEEWIRGVEKIFVIIEVLEEKRVNI